MAQEPWLQVFWVAIAATSMKLLLVPSYKSTDFEVHRYWMAITWSLPVSKWYFEETSQWTLDYPPFFAWFERLLAIPASIIEPKMVNLKEGIDLANPSTVIFMVSHCPTYGSDVYIRRGRG